jgi:hypothetical protein
MYDCQGMSQNGVPLFDPFSKATARIKFCIIHGPAAVEKDAITVNKKTIIPNGHHLIK